MNAKQDSLEKALAIKIEMALDPMQEMDLTTVEIDFPNLLEEAFLVKEVHHHRIASMITKTLKDGEK